MEVTSTVVVKLSFIPNEVPSSKHDGRSGTQLQPPSSPLCGNPNMYWYGEEGEKGTTSGPVYIPPVHSDYPQPIAGATTSMRQNVAQRGIDWMVFVREVGSQQNRARAEELS